MANVVITTPILKPVSPSPFHTPIKTDTKNEIMAAKVRRNAMAYVTTHAVKPLGKAWERLSQDRPVINEISRTSTTVIVFSSKGENRNAPNTNVDNPERTMHIVNPLVDIVFLVSISAGNGTVLNTVPITINMTGKTRNEEDRVSSRFSRPSN